MNPEYVHPHHPGELNETCTQQFFDDDVSGACHQTSLASALGLGSESVNVTVEEDGEIRPHSGTALRAGPPVPDDASVVVARRLVVLDGEESDLYVRVW